MSSVLWEAERRLRQRDGQRQLQTVKRESYWLLSFIDDVNGVRVGGKKEMARALEGAAERAGIRWDREKDWRGKTGRHL